MIDKFDGEFAFLSNFSPSPIVVDGLIWPTVEHIYQAWKTLDPQRREEIRHAATPGKAKRLGRVVPLRPFWDDIKKGIMMWILHMKFDQNPELALQLLATGDRMLAEGNVWHDNIWGDCACKKCAIVRGQNLLGELLMKVRKSQRQLGL